jgi:hypothetical protein
MEPQPSDKFPRYSILLAVAVCLSNEGCASAAPPNHGLPPERLAQLRNICTDTMQLPPGYSHFEDCMDVLSETARRLDRTRAQP